MSDSIWDILTGHLSNPIRGRIFFELMMNSEDKIDIKSIAKLSGKARNTVNHHIDKMIFDGIIEEVGAKDHTRGKPTRYFGLNPDFVKRLRKTTNEDKTVSDIISNSKRKAALLSLLSNISRETSEFLTQNSKNLMDGMSIDHLFDNNFPLYIFSVRTKQELSIYQKHMVQAILNANSEVSTLGNDRIQGEKAKFTVFSGFVSSIKDYGAED